ncbi:type II toxin-antitoxin system MqsR family toxin [Azospirillum sp. TSH58]|uniref:type II toxin-antitoxin system MqsR family toxin n=1 Tax=Azospirillum sp. TSH58 TaxID=664962 RepID=UPI000D645C5B|nr:type II toxin-antitoxin system MqsR family toxin [Azospirillum sp. TSH58]
MATDAEVQAFLRRFVQAVASHGVHVWKTKKNDAFLMDTGFTNADVVDALKTLRVQNYSAGPELDDDPNRPAGEVWKFMREYEGYNLYVKLKLDASTGLPIAECLSFHPAERQMQQPNLPRR